MSDSGATIGVWTTNRPTTKTVTSCTNPYTAKYQRRQAMLMAMRPVEVIAMLRDLNLTSHAFSVNAQELQSRISRYVQIGKQPAVQPRRRRPVRHGAVPATGEHTRLGEVAHLGAAHEGVPVTSGLPTGFRSAVDVHLDQDPRSSLPVALRGSSSMNTTSRGTLWRARLSLT